MNDCFIENDNTEQYGTEHSIWIPRTTRMIELIGIVPRVTPFYVLNNIKDIHFALIWGQPGFAHAGEMNKIPEGGNFAECFKFWSFPPIQHGQFSADVNGS